MKRSGDTREKTHAAARTGNCCYTPESAEYGTGVVKRDGRLRCRVLVRRQITLWRDARFYPRASDVAVNTRIMRVARIRVMSKSR